MTKQLLIVSWCAVSSEPQAEKESLIEQRAQNHLFVANLPRLYPTYAGEVVAELQVVGSRSITELDEACRRYPAYAKLIHVIRSNAIDAIVCRSRDRLGRADSLAITIERLCAKHGVVVIPRQNPPVTLDPDYFRYADGSGLAAAIESHMAAASVRRLVNDHNMGMIARIERGDFAGRLPWGYSVKFDDDGNKIVAINEGAAQTLREILVDLYADQKLSLRAIAKHLNDSGSKPARAEKWVSTTVEKIIRNADRYAGYVYVNRNSKRGRQYTVAVSGHLPIISENELHAIRAVQEERRRPVRRPKQVLRSVYAGSVICTYTQAPLRTLLNNGVVTFRCTECAKQGRTIHSISESRVAEAIDSSWQAFADPADLASYLLQVRTKAAQENENQSAQVKAQLGQLKRQQQALMQAYINGEVATDSFDSAMQSLVEESQLWRVQLAEANSTLSCYERPNAAEIASLLETIRAALFRPEDFDQAQVHQWVNQFIRVYVGKGENGRYAQNVERVAFI